MNTTNNKNSATIKKFVMAGLDPATQDHGHKLKKDSPQSHEAHEDALCTSWLRGEIFAAANVTLGGRVKPGHDDVYFVRAFASSRENALEARE